ncbi:MAG: hypothetical protein QOF37_1492 [Thermoleophilaceae bacterium]|nr:hypothetical protein [Thermoleophilaceae bacterium]
MPLGPDGEGTWAGTAGRCGVAVAAALRHAVPEDRADAQPRRSADGSLVFAGDVRIDNRPEIAGALGLADEARVPDSAFVIAGYERWGDAVLDRVLGEFAFAIVDRRRGGVLIARDHVGARPLMIHRRRGVVAFASTAPALGHLEGVGHSLDVRRAAEVLALVYVSERTFVEGVSQVPPATAIWVDAAGVRQWTWWRPELQAADLGSQAAHERELREALDLAVAARLRSTGPVGAMVSGGLDSSSVAATGARQVGPALLPTYTSAPPPGWHAGERPMWDADESPLVMKLAAMHPNMAPSFVHVPHGHSVIDVQDPLWELGAGPARNPCNMLWTHAIAERAAADGVTTLLSGARGNICFSADGPDWLAQLVRAGRLRTALREGASWTKVTGMPAWRTAARLAMPLLPSPARRLVRRAAGRDEAKTWIESCALRPDLLAEVDPAARVPALRQPPPDPRELELWLVKAAGAHAQIQAATAALTGVEERDPTVDRRVIEAALRQPEWVRRHEGMNRAVVRGAMADRLPPEISRRTRRGEQLPDWFDLMTAARGELDGELAALREHPASRELIDVGRLETLMTRWPDRVARADPTIVRDYRLALLRALSVSRYLRWFERHAAVSAAESRVGGSAP